MKKFFYVLCCFLLIPSFIVFSSAKSTIHCGFPEPDAPFGTAFVIDAYHTYMFTCDIGYAIPAGIPIFEYGIASIGNGKCRIYYENRSGVTLHVNLSVFNNSDGSIFSNHVIQVPVPSSDHAVYGDFTFDNLTTDGLWIKGLCWFDSSTIPLMDITFTDDPYDYSSDFAAVKSYLSSISSSVSSIFSVVDSIESYTALINTKAAQMNELLSSINTKFYTFNQAYTANWTWFKTTYYNYISGQWSNLDSKLDEIIDLLQGSSSTTIPVDPSYSDDVSGFVDSEHDVMSQAEVDPDVVVSNIDSAFDNIGSYDNGFHLIHNIFDSFITGVPQVYIVLFFSLTFGLVLTIIGKSASR